MKWLLKKFPTLSDSEKAEIAQWITDHSELMEQARDDAATYLFPAVLGNLTAIYYYSQAISTIESLNAEFRELRTSDTLFSEGDENLAMYYNQYLAEFEDLNLFLKTGYGLEVDDTDSLTSDWADYTLKYLGGNDDISVQDGGYRVFAHLGDGDDIFVGNSGSDRVYGGNGADSLNGGGGIDVLDGGAGDDSIAGEGGSDLIYGDSGDDLLTGGNENDFIDGGEGQYDFAVYSGEANEYTLSFNEDSLLAISDSFVERDGDDLLVNVEFLKFSDSVIDVSIVPGGPNDSPSDLILAEQTFSENITANSIVATLNSIDPDSGDTHTYSLVSGTDDTDNTAFTIDGDQLKIKSSPDYETQESYSVRLKTTDSGGLSYEKAFTLTVNDIKPETIRSSTNLTLPDNVENLVLTGKSNLKGYGNSGKNWLIGNEGNNVLDGRGGIDTLIGKGGNDTYIVDEIQDRVIEKADGGTDTIRSSVNETLSAHVENLELTGSGNLKGYGNSSNNRLTGNSGNNVLEGKGGRDILTGKGGSDKFVYRSVDDSGVTNSTRDIITDFSPFIDQIDLSKIDAYTATSGNQKFVYIGSDLFSGTQGEVRFASSILGVNTGTDTKADMQIKLNGVTDFSADYLIL
jgi:serralysin